MEEQLARLWDKDLLYGKVTALQFVAHFIGNAGDVIGAQLLLGCAVDADLQQRKGIRPPQSFKGFGGHIRIRATRKGRREAIWIIDCADHRQLPKFAIRRLDAQLVAHL